MQEGHAGGNYSMPRQGLTQAVVCTNSFMKSRARNIEPQESVRRVAVSQGRSGPAGGLEELHVLQLGE